MTDDERRTRIERDGRVAVLHIERPQALNALDLRTMQEVLASLRTLDGDLSVGAVVLSGTARAFAAGADVSQMADLGLVEVQELEWFADWQRIGEIRTPVIAAVRGFALGGGCELAMLCDIVLAGASARFGLPEVSLGVMPGMGGTQRLVRAVGKSVAMEMILAGRVLDAEEAREAGLVSRVLPDDEVLPAARTTAATIASMPTAAVRLAKEAVNAADEIPLSAGVRLERRLFQTLFGHPGQHEGMHAFLEKRPPRFAERDAPDEPESGEAQPGAATEQSRA